MIERPRIRSEAGFTLIELLVAMSVGMVVLFAVHAAFDSTLTASARVEDRTEAVQRGRAAMEQLTQRLRSQACPFPTDTDPNPAAIQAATNERITLYVDIGDDEFAPELRTLAYANGSLVEETPAGSRAVLTDVTAVPDVPVFRYYAFDSNGVVSTTPLPAPLPSGLSALDRARVVKIGISFTSRSARTADDDDVSANGDLTFQNSVYVRTADPFEPEEGPVCG